MESNTISASLEKKKKNLQSFRKEFNFGELWLKFVLFTDSKLTVLENKVLP